MLATYGENWIIPPIVSSRILNRVVCVDMFLEQLLRRHQVKKQVRKNSYSVRFSDCFSLGSVLARLLDTATM